MKPFESSSVSSIQLLLGWHIDGRVRCRNCHFSLYDAIVNRGHAGRSFPIHRIPQRNKSAEYHKHPHFFTQSYTDFASGIYVGCSLLITSPAYLRQRCSVVLQWLSCRWFIQRFHWGPWWGYIVWTCCCLVLRNGVDFSWARTPLDTTRRVPVFNIPGSLRLPGTAQRSFDVFMVLHDKGWNWPDIVIKEGISTWS